MGDWTSGIYITSQIFIIAAYVFYGITFFVKSRGKLLGLFLLGNLMQGIGFSFLLAWAGLGACLVAFGRDGINYIINSKRAQEDKNKTTALDYGLMVFWLSILGVITYFTQDGFLSWFAFFPTALFTMGLCLKNIGLYRFIGITAHSLWVVYNVYVDNLFGVILRSALLATAVVGFVLFIIKLKEKNNQNNLSAK
jgi:hypothetical protein